VPPPEAPPLVELDDVCLRIGEATIVDHVSVAIPDHGITVVLGPSGSGKSTLLRLMNRLEVPTSGTVRFRGADLDQLDPLRLRRQLGLVFQRPTPFPGSVRDNLKVAAPQALDSELADELERSGLPAEFLDRDTDGLSGGEAQRVCLARALAAAPDALLMDEPTSSLDPDSRAAVEDLAMGLARSGLPIVWVTHDLAQAERLEAAHEDRPGSTHAHALVLIDGRLADDAEAEAFRRGTVEGAP
jgi:putative ABC transport system ATP-binding protein